MNQAVVRALLVAATFALATAAVAQVKIGVTVSATGPAASLGIPEKNTIALCPKTIAGSNVEYIVLDDATDTTTAVQNTRKLIGEHKVDAIIGSTTTPNSLAMIDVFAEAETPVISLASSIRIIDPVDAKKAWSFKTPQTDVMMAGAILEHAAATGVKTLGYIGFNDALGEAFFAEVDKAAATRKMPLIGSERYAPKDTSVTGQVLKLIAARPDAIVVGASGTPAALPASALIEHGYKGRLYFNHGVANNDFLRVGGKDVEGAFVPASPVIVASQLPETHPASFRRYLKERLADRIHPGAFHFIEGDRPDPEAEARRVGELIRGCEIDLAFVGIGENGHLAFNDPPADFATEEPYIVVRLDEACRRQQLGEGWFPSLEDVPRRAIVSRSEEAASAAAASPSEALSGKTRVCNAR